VGGVKVILVVFPTALSFEVFERYLAYKFNIENNASFLSELMFSSAYLAFAGDAPLRPPCLEWFGAFARVAKLYYSCVVSVQRFASRRFFSSS
jgi:hypothetical protein